MEQTKHLKGLLWLGTISAALVLGGIISILAANWVSVPFIVQILLALLPLGGALGTLVWYVKRNQPAFEIEEVLGTAWSGGILCSIALLARILQLPSDGFAFCVTMTLLLSAVTYFTRSTFALFMQIGFLFAIVPLKHSQDEKTLFFTLLLCALPLLPRLREIWHRQSVFGTILRYLLSICASVYVSLLIHLFLEAQFFDLPENIHQLLPIAHALLFMLGLWIEQRRPGWNRPLTTLSACTMTIYCLVTMFMPHVYLHWISAIILFIPLLVLIRKIIRSELVLLFLLPTTLIASGQGWIGNFTLILVTTALLILGLLRGSRFIANIALLFLLAFCFTLMAQYNAELMTCGIVFIICGLLFLAINICFARFSNRLIHRFPTLAEPAFLPALPLAPRTSQLLKRILLGLAVVGCIAQLLIPGWLLLKHHLILTRGERFELTVSLYDPRDLFAGRYVSLTCNELPDAFKAVKRNFLRYYCDERYAYAYEVAVRKNVQSTLIVRLWRGEALAEALLINGIPAHEYIQQLAQKHPQATSPVRSKPLTFIALTPQAATSLALLTASDTNHFVEHLYPDQTDSVRFPIFVGMDSVWNKVLNEIAAKRHPADIPHPIWMDRWMKGETLPPEAFLPTTEKERAARFPEYWSFTYHGWRHQVMLPVFTGLPSTITSDKSFEEAATCYYKHLVDTYPDSWKSECLFTTCAPKDASQAQQIWAVLSKALPNAHWFIFETASLPEGFPWNLPTERITLVSPTPPPANLSWIYQPTENTPLQESFARFQNEAACQGWCSADSDTNPIAFAYWQQYNTLANDPTHAFAPKQAFESALNAYLAQPPETATLTDDLRLLYSLAGMTLRQTLAQAPTDTIAAEWLQRIDALLQQDCRQRRFAMATSATAYAQWHLRNYGAFPDWNTLGTPLPRFTPEDWRTLAQHLSIKITPP